MANERYTGGIIPLDLSNDTAWVPGGNYKLGPHVFKVTKWGSETMNGRKKLVMEHLIVDGPEGDKDRQFNVFFTIDNDKSRGILKGYVQKVAGDSGFVRGQPNADVLVGIVFKANVISKSYKKEGAETSTTQFVLDMNTIEPIGRDGAKAAASAMDNLRPVSA